MSYVTHHINIVTCPTTRSETSDYRELQTIYMQPHIGVFDAWVRVPEERHEYFLPQQHGDMLTRPAVVHR